MQNTKYKNVSLNAGQLPADLPTTFLLGREEEVRSCFIHHDITKNTHRRRDLKSVSRDPEFKGSTLFHQTSHLPPVGKCRGEN